MVSPSAARKSLALSPLDVYETLAISWPTVAHAALGRRWKAVARAL